MSCRGILVVLALAVCAHPVVAEDQPGKADGAAAPADSEEPKTVPVRSAGGYVFHLVVSADGSRVAASTANSVDVWDVTERKPVLHRQERRSAGMRFQGIDLSKDGQWLMTRESGVLRDGTGSRSVPPVFEDLTRVWRVERSERPVGSYGPERSREGTTPAEWKILVATFDAPGDGLMLWRELVGPSFATPELGDDGLAWTEPPTPAIEHPWERKTLRKWPGHVYGVSWSPDGSLVAISESGAVNVHSWPDETLRLPLSVSNVYGFHGEFGCRGEIIAASARRDRGERKDDTDVVVAWSRDGDMLWEREDVRLLAISPAGPPCDAVLQLETGGVELVDALTGERRGRCPGGGRGSISAATFSPDGRHLWFAHRKAGEIRRYDVPSHDEE